MPLPSPALDDRSFRDLVEEAQRQIRSSSPSWTDLSPGDPGTAILEVFAHLTETMIYRLNRLPEKAYIEFLRLLGVTLSPPTAAHVTLRFSRERPSKRATNIPRGTRVTVERPIDGEESPVFLTARATVVEAGETTVEVLAYNAQQVDAEVVGHGTGLPGQWTEVGRPPIVAPTGDELDLVVGVETDRDLGELVRAVEYDGRTFVVWREVEHFMDLGVDRRVFVADRTAGRITFAPAVRLTESEGSLENAASALAEVPLAGAEIRVWYRQGGGSSGNVGANSLTTLKDPIAGISVTNPEPATGGRDGESLENALKRGPQEFHSLRRTVTARDFELVAVRSSGAVARARAYTKASVWAHAPPGAVEVLLVPRVEDPTRVTREQLLERQSDEAQQQILNELDGRRPLGTRCEVSWARYKTVAVRARVIVYRQEDPEAVRQRVQKRLYQLVNPLDTGDGGTGWRFGEALRVSHIYQMVLEEPGVSYVERVKMIVDETPSAEVASIVSDHHQENTWFAGADDTVFRSVNDGAGWEAVAQFTNERVRRVAVHADVPGLVAAVNRTEGQDDQSAIHLSTDCGESWSSHAVLGFRVNDCEWISRDGKPILLLATTVGLYEVSATEPNPVQIAVEPDDQKLGFFSVTAATDIRGGVTVAVGAEEKRGCYLSPDGGKPHTFRHAGLEGHDVRTLAAQSDPPLTYLWAGLWVDGPDDEGDGCYRLRLLTSAAEADSELQWEQFKRGWQGGSCFSLTLVGATVAAGTHRAGVLTLNAAGRKPAWVAPALDCNLPLRDVGRFQPVDTVAASHGIILAGGPDGVYRSTDEGLSYENRSSPEFPETVTLPGSWLLCSGVHEVEIVSEDESRAEQ